MNYESLKKLLDDRVGFYNRPAFIHNDPIAIPHLFNKQQDIEIAGLFAAIFAWGNRTTIINKSKDLLARMDHVPHDFILHHQESDLKKLLHFKHRTFNDTDLLYFIEFLRYHYSKYDSLESAFVQWMHPNDKNIRSALSGFHQYFFSLEDAPYRTRKHIASPDNNATCKRLNMFLRWMVRNNKTGVDFGIWKFIKPSQLIIPIDVHVARIARSWGLLDRSQNDWKSAIELTEKLKEFNPKDPVLYDFALFGTGVNKSDL